MHNLVVVSDIHIGAPHHEDVSAQDLRVLKRSEENVVLTGDIFDVSNMKKTSLATYVVQIESIIKIYKEDFLMGNHECMDMLKGDVNRSYTIKTINNKRVLFFHGPGVYIGKVYYPIYYSESQSNKWANKEWGRGKFSHFAYRMFRKISKHSGGYKEPSKDIKKQIHRVLSLLCCDVAVFGHTHRNCNTYYLGKRIINVGKGITKLSI